MAFLEEILELERNVKRKRSFYFQWLPVLKIYSFLANFDLFDGNKQFCSKSVPSHRKNYSRKSPLHNFFLSLLYVFMLLASFLSSTSDKN